MQFLLILYILFLLGYIIYSVIAIYHLWRFGYVGDLTKPAIVFYIAISLVIIALSFILIATRQWPSDFSI